MSRLAIAMSLLAMFLVGVSLGLAGGIFFTQRVHPGPSSPFGMRGHGGPRPSVPEVMSRLERTLDLTPAQLTRIEPLVVASRREFEAARESLRSRIEKELTPEQRVRWQQMARERERARAFPGQDRGPEDRTHRAPPGHEGVSR